VILLLLADIGLLAVEGIGIHGQAESAPDQVSVNQTGGFQEHQDALHLLVGDGQAGDDQQSQLVGIAAGPAPVVQVRNQPGVEQRCQQVLLAKLAQPSVGAEVR
jgi:hypothetical protein